MGYPHRAFETLLRPAPPHSMQVLAFVVPGFLILSAVLVVLGSWAMPSEYSWRIHSISESAAQGQPFAWIARFSFLSYGVAVLLLSIGMRAAWPRLTFWCGSLFAGSMFGVAAFSHAPWQPGVEGDAIEDFLHSLFASGMGLAFVLGVTARFVHRGHGDPWGRALDVLAVAVATVLPLMLASASSVGGAVQRIMFFVGYVWFGREALIGWKAQSARPA